MKLKNKSQMTGRELCDLEGYVFPILSSFGEDADSQKKAFLELIKNDGENVVKLCYTKDDGSKLEEINETYRFALMTDMPNILSFILDIDGQQEEGKPQVKSTPRKIRR